MLPVISDIRPTSGEYISVAEAALRAKLDPRTIYLWARKGKLRLFGHGHGTRVLMSEVMAPRIPKPLRPAKPRVRKQRAEQKRESATATLGNTPAQVREPAATCDIVDTIGHDAIEIGHVNSD